MPVYCSFLIKPSWVILYIALKFLVSVSASPGPALVLCNSNVNTYTTQNYLLLLSKAVIQQKLRWINADINLQCLLRVFYCSMILSFIPSSIIVNFKTFIVNHDTVKGPDLIWFVPKWLVFRHSRCFSFFKHLRLVYNSEVRAREQSGYNNDGFRVDVFAQW